MATAVMGPMAIWMETAFRTRRTMTWTATGFRMRRTRTSTVTGFRMAKINILTAKMMARAAIAARDRLRAAVVNGDPAGAMGGGTFDQTFGGAENRHRGCGDSLCLIYV